jgi:hypothetical protein
MRWVQNVPTVSIAFPASVNPAATVAVAIRSVQIGALITMTAGLIIVNAKNGQAVGSAANAVQKPTSSRATGVAIVKVHLTVGTVDTKREFATKAVAWLIIIMRALMVMLIIKNVFGAQMTSQKVP